MKNKNPGKIITFYSYKGGTGRTMALANTACLLARNYNNQDKQRPVRVLAIDWDFEAPGLHRFFLPYISETSKIKFSIKEGWLDLFLELNNQKSKFDPTDSIGNQKKTNEILQSINVGQYLVETTIPGLSFVKAGRFDSEYPQNASTFPWETFFTETIGLFTGLVDFLRDQFDYVLIDSRTGITDTSGICTMLLPDKLIVVFTPNNQNLDGLRELVRKAVAYRKNSEDWRPLTVFPLPSRIEMTRPKQLEFWRFGEFASELEATSRLESPAPFQPLFENLFGELYGDSMYDLTEYFNEVLLQHVAEYAYGEPIAVEIEKSESRILLKRSYEAFVERLVELDAPWQSLEETRAEREIVKICGEAKESLEKKQVEKAVRKAFNLIEKLIPNTLIETVFETLLSIAETNFRSNPENAMALLEGAISLAKQGKEQNPVTSIQQIETAISLTLLDQRNLLKAKELRNEVLTLAKSTFGENHPATLTSMNNLAQTLQAQGDFA
ncbi:KGGVGR-motif variant AAA ATPase, partial [Nitrospira sp. T9]|uniref:KGGVGR-motif variant AAA ATPase n=1 Tax=unclassified Nitrospira TaxID=2652172 RepID=UPI003F97550E